MEPVLSSRLRELRDAAETVARDVAAPHAEEVDREARWPEHSMDALKEAGLMGLHVPRELGGEGQGLVALVATTEALGRACSSTAMCFAMHCVGTAVIAAKATPYQREHYLRPIAEGRHISSLALSETGTGSHLYLSQTSLRREEDVFIADGTKQFITNGGRADSYVVSSMTSDPDAEAGEFSCLIVDAGTPGMRWLDPWAGLGMRGNSSRGLRLEGAQVPVENLLGEEGDQIWYVFEVVGPYFLLAMSATYLGIARAALDEALQHLRRRRFSHSGESLAEIPVLQYKIADMWTSVEKSRHLVYQAAALGDVGDAGALPAIFMSKADVAETVVAVANEALTLCGGIAYGENAHLARLLRDARASHVMAPTTFMLKQWTARSLLGLPLL